MKNCYCCNNEAEYYTEVLDPRDKEHKTYWMCARCQSAVASRTIYAIKTQKARSGIL